MRKWSILGVLLVSGASVEAQVPYEPNTCRSAPSDTTFLPTSTTGSGNPSDPDVCDDNFGGGGAPCQTITNSFNITRVVGPGQAPYINSDGTLVNPDAYVANGIVSRYAYLQISWGAGFSFSTTFHFTINGQSIPGGDIAVVGQGSSWPYVVGAPPPSNVSGTLCLQFPIQYLRFATRNVGSMSMPTPGVNQVQVSSTNPQALATDDTTVHAGAVSLSFDAMAPIIMVHGWQSGPWWWGDSPSTATPCGPDKNYQTGKGTRNGGFDFVKPFSAGLYPFDCSLEITNTDDDQPGALLLQQKLLNCQNGGFPDANFMCPDGSGAIGKLTEFGAKHAHLVVHSKGGLWARQMLKNVSSQFNANGNQLFGIYSLTTLETPHLGSSLADLLIAGRTVPLLQLAALATIDVRILATLFRSSAGADDMQVAIATAFSGMWGSR